ncbi:MAG: hypothetical protein EAX90_02930 [Candidatus Heimdallarchaeota archaeon]|nr:hypothetical protein [Candidatus Heimdallarchaeota archaeon]
MDNRKLIGKIAADKESNKLGKIIRVDELTGKTIKKLKPHAMIIYRKIFKKDVIVPIDIEKLFKTEGSYAWFDISKKDFVEEAERLSLIKSKEENYDGYISDIGGTKLKAGRVFSSHPDVTGLSKSRKERKR